MKKIIGLLSVVTMFGLAGYSLFFSPGASQADQKATTTQTTEQTTQSSHQAQKAAKKKSETSDLPSAKPTDWDLALVGPKDKIQTELKDDQLALLSDGSHQVDQRIAKSYEAFSAAATKAGFPLVVISAFRSVASQQEVFDNNVYALMSSDGLSEKAATKKTKETITVPGYSEHHTGLALDVVDQNWYNNYPTQVLDAAYGNEPGAKWIAKNAPTYGFIIRYPKNREDITGITYEPWHIRYVGKKNAQYITKHNLTLEEYLNKLK